MRPAHRRLRLALVLKGIVVTVSTLYFSTLWNIQENLDRIDGPSLKSVRVSLSDAAVITDKPIGAPVTTSIPKDSSVYVRPTASYVRDPSDRWEFQNSTVPPWLQSYFRWHKETMATLNEGNWNEIKYTKLVCPAYSNHCGGLADRVGPMPYHLRIAAQSHRILFIEWEKPAPLEEFLRPPIGGMDWRIPGWLIPLLKQDGDVATVHDRVLEAVLDKNLQVAKLKFQTNDHGATYYNIYRQPGELEFHYVFRDIWRVLFTPSPRVANKLQTFWKENRLEPGVYSSAHLRALYAVRKRPSPWVRRWTRHAVDCLALYGNRVYFASDSNVATKCAVDYGRQIGMTVISSSQHEKPPLHIDKTPNWSKMPPSEFDPAFVDLYVLGSSRCVGTSMGNYGRLASWMSSNVSCSFAHHASPGIIPCDQQNNLGYSDVESPWPVEPMPLKQRTSKPRTIDKLYPFLNNSSKSSSLWEASTLIPKWLKDYFSWHNRVRRSLTAENWMDRKYLVMVCLKTTKTCGGTSDRLQPVPFLLRLAAETERLLLIHWEKPAALENFLLPPRGGIDWRVPDFVRPDIIDPGLSSVRLAVPRAQSDIRLVTTKIQSHDHGSAYYSNSTGVDVDSYRETYHDIWYTMFTPVESIARKIEKQLHQMKLVPGHFAFAHLRANYGIEDKGRQQQLVSNWTRNAFNCLSELKVNGPVFFATDNHGARKAARAYGKKRGFRIETRFDEIPPLHLDLATDWEKPSDFNDVFVDLYLMSMGRCMTYNMGGYGKWAQLISGRDVSCSVRHWTKGVNKATAKKGGCEWSGIEDSKVSGGAFVQPLFIPPV